MTALAQSAVANTSALSSTDVSVTLPAPPTPGNLLVAVLCISSQSVSSGPWGAALDAQSLITALERCNIYSKVAAVGEPATVTATMSVAAATHRLSVYEFSPTAPLVWGGLDQIAVTQDAGAVVSTLSTGTTPPTVAAEGVAVAGFVMNSTFTALTLTNGYPPLLNASSVSGYKALTAPGPQETTAAWTTARRVAGAIAAYKQIVKPANAGAFLALL